MGLFDKFLDAVRLNDEYDEDEDEFFDDDEPAVLFAGGGDHGDPRDGMTPDLPIDIGRVDAEDLLDEEPAAFLMTDQIDLMGLVDRGDHVVTGER